MFSALIPRPNWSFPRLTTQGGSIRCHRRPEKEVNTHKFARRPEAPRVSLVGFVPHHDLIGI